MNLLETLIRDSAQVPSRVDWSRVIYRGVSVPDLLIAATFPGHEPDLLRELHARMRRLHPFPDPVTSDSEEG